MGFNMELFCYLRHSLDLCNHFLSMSDWHVCLQTGFVLIFITTLIALKDGYVNSIDKTIIKTSIKILSSAVKDIYITGHFLT